MIEPLSMLASATVEAGAATGEGVGAAAHAGGVAEVGGHLGAGGDLARVTSVGGTTESVLATLGLDASALGDALLARAEQTGAALSEALGSGPGAELGATGTPGSGEARLGGQHFDAKRWVEWRPAEGEVIQPKVIVERFRELGEPGALNAYIKDLAQRDRGFGDELDRRKKQLAEAQTPADRDAAVQQLRRSTAGKLGEAIARDALGPLFDEVELQRAVSTENGVTKLDLRLEGARQPIIIGRGLSVAQGGHLSVEVKVGTPESLTGQLRHAASLQVLGHHESGGQSLVLVSKDVYAMSGERMARDTVAGAGSRVMALLPEKGAMDAALLRVVEGRAGGA